MSATSAARSAAHTGVARLTPLVAAAAATAGCAVLLVADPNDGGLYPPCPFLALTGRWCPGCGSLRGLRALLRGDIAAAAGFNVLLVVAVPYLLYSWAAWVAAATGRDRPPPLRLSGRTTLGVAAAIVVFWFARNLPLSPFGALAP